MPEQQQRTKLEWFHQSVTAEPLTTRVPVDLSVTVVRSHDDDDGSFTAHLGGSRAVTGNLARRPRSTTEWDLGWGGEIHRWTTRDHDWALTLHGLSIDEPALAELKTKLHTNTRHKRRMITRFCDRYRVQGKEFGDCPKPTSSDK